MTTKEYQRKSPLRIFLSYFAPHKKLFLVDVLCAVLIAGVDLLFPLVTRSALYEMLPNNLFGLFFAVMAAMVACYLIRAFLNYIVCYFGHTFGIRVEADIRSDLFRHFQTLGFDFYDRNRTGQLMSRLTSDLFELTELAHHGPEDLLTSGVTIVGALVAMAFIRWQLALVMAVMIPVFLVVIMLVVSSLLYLAAKAALNSAPAASGGKGIINSGAVKLQSWKKFVPGTVFALVTFLAGLPHLALICCAFSTRYSGTVFPENFTLENFQLALSNPLVLPSIANSLKYSLIAMFIACLTGLLTALASVRWRLKGSALADLLAMLPLAVPGVVFAFGFLGMSVKFTWASMLFDPVNNPVWLLSIAYAVRRIPYVVRAVSSGLEQTPEELEKAARNFGAGPWRTLMKITLPLVTANLIVGGLFAFSFSMLEVSDSLILAQKQEFFPITRALFELSQILGFGTGAACAFGVWAMFFLGLTLCAGALLLGKKIGAVFKF